MAKIYVLEETLFGPQYTDRNLIGAWHTTKQAHKELIRMRELRNSQKNYAFEYIILTVDLHDK